MQETVRNSIQVDVSGALNFENADIAHNYMDKLKKLELHNQSLFSTIHSPEVFYKDILSTAEYLQSVADTLLVLGVGGSQSGTKAMVEALMPDKMRVYFAGHGFSGHYLNGILKKLEGRRVAVIVISKSGDTAETLLTFGIVRQWLERHYGKEYKKQVIAITGRKHDGGTLGSLCRQEGYRQIFVPDDVGGRYSIFTAVGLLPLAAAGVDIMEFLDGAAAGESLYVGDMSLENPAVKYALTRNVLYKTGYTNELWATFAPYLVGFGAWWRQLFVESESKNGNGIYPVVAEYSNDLHYLGQYLRQGPRNIFETVLWLDEPPYNMEVDRETSTMIGWQEAKDLAKVSKMVKENTRKAHMEAGVPQISISVPLLDVWQLGRLVVFFVQACLTSGFLQGCNPLDQPGVEEYKRQILEALK